MGVFLTAFVNNYVGLGCASQLAYLSTCLVVGGLSHLKTMWSIVQMRGKTAWPTQPPDSGNLAKVNELVSRWMGWILRFRYAKRRTTGVGFAVRFCDVAGDARSRRWSPCPRELSSALKIV